MGVTINKKKSTGDWYIWVCSNGRRMAKKVGKDKKLANQLAKEYRKKLLLGELDWDKGRKSSEDLTFSDFCKTYLKNVQNRLKYNTVKSYAGIIKLYLLNTLGNKQLASISKSDIRKLLQEKQNQGLVVKNIRICLSAIFQHAVEQEILQVNPASGLGKSFPTKKVFEPKILNKNQVGAFLKIVQEHKPQYYTFFLTAFRSGMRLGELLALTWENVNFNTEQIKVCKSYSHKHFDIPKSNKIRFVDMSRELQAELKNHYQKNKPTGLVFVGNNGKPFNDNQVRKVFYQLLSQAKLPKMRIHDIRHTYASLLLQTGAPIHYVRDQLGHSTISTTVDLYGHIIPGSNRNAINALDDIPSDLI